MAAILDGGRPKADNDINLTNQKAGHPSPKHSGGSHGSRPTGLLAAEALAEGIGLKDWAKDRSRKDAKTGEPALPLSLTRSL